MRCSMRRSGPLLSRTIFHPVYVAAGLFLAAGVTVAGQQPPKPATDAATVAPAAVTKPADNGQPVAEGKKPVSPVAPAEALTSGQKQLADESAELLQLAQELKKEVDRTDKDTLSVNVIRKAEMIEKLAKGVKQKMKVSGGAS